MDFPRVRSPHSSARSWDVAIGVLLTASGVTALLAAILLQSGIEGGVPRPLLMLVSVLGTLGFATVFYGSFIEPQMIRVRRMTLPFPVRLRIAVVSDFHVGPYKGRAFVRRAVEKLRALAPDLALIPGDFLYDDQSDPADLEPLADLTAPLGVFGVFGNHDEGRLQTFIGKRAYTCGDGTAALRALLARIHVQLLEHAHAILKVNGQPFAVAGTIDPWERDVDLQQLFADLPDGLPVILLAHTPDVTLSPHISRAKLVFTGHTHGGQVRLPFVGSLVRIPMRADQRYDRGVFRIAERTTLVVSSGIGESGPRARLFSPPEILLVETEPE